MKISSQRTTLCVWVVLLFLSITACTDKDGGPVPLIDGFQSRSSVEEVRRVVEASGRTWKLADDYTPGAGHSSQSYTVSPFEDRGFPGEAYVEFFDGKLVRVSFFPVDPAGYLARLAADLSIPLERAIPSPSDSRVVIRTGNYEVEGRYASWEDRLLAAEMARWLD